MPTTADVLADHPARSSFDHHELARAIDSCLAAVAASTACADACLSGDDAASMRRCIQLGLDCADICGATVRVLSRPTPAGEVWRRLVETCARACRESAVECESHTGHKHCQQCAKITREAEAALSQLLAAAAG